ncbi:hypothetical protein ACFLX1_02670, partial [Chloroflexota bacterium]
MHRTTNTLLAFPSDRQAFRPATGYVYGAERVQVKAFRTLAAVGHQVYFHKTGLVLLSVGKGPDGYRALQQTSRLCSRK